VNALRGLINISLTINQSSQFQKTNYDLLIEFDSVNNSVVELFVFKTFSSPAKAPTTNFGWGVCDADTLIKNYFFIIFINTIKLLINLLDNNGRVNNSFP
jgi:hypothetical protein